MNRDEAKRKFFVRCGWTIALGSLIISSGIANGRRSFFLPDISPFLGDLGEGANKLSVVVLGLDVKDLWNKKIQPFLLTKNEEEHGAPSYPIFAYCDPPEDITAIDFNDLLAGKDVKGQVDTISNLVEDKGVHCEYGETKRKLYQGTRSSNEDSGVYEAIPLNEKGKRYTIAPFKP